MITHKRLTVQVLLLMSLTIGQLMAAAIVCEGDSDATIKSKSEIESTQSTPKPSDWNQFLHNVQCSLERAKPWVENIEKEAKRLEESAKRVGLGIVHRVGDLMDSLLGVAANRRPVVNEITTTNNPMVPCANTDTDTLANGANNVNADVPPETESLSTESPSSTPSPLSGLVANEVDNEITNVEPLK